MLTRIHWCHVIEHSWRQFLPASMGGEAQTDDILWRFLWSFQALDRAWESNHVDVPYSLCTKQVWRLVPFWTLFVQKLTFTSRLDRPDRSGFSIKGRIACRVHTWMGVLVSEFLDGFRLWINIVTPELPGSHKLWPNSRFLWYHSFDPKPDV